MKNNGTIKGGFHIVEIFDSIEGEGKRTGYMAIFVRLASCNLRCTYCDTSYALTLKDTKEILSEKELIEKIHSYPWKKITFTGGEPMLHPLQNICETLGKEGYEINIETSGSIPLFDKRPPNLFYTMDFKCTGSGMKQYMIEENFEKLNKDDVLKFVVGDLTDLGDMRKIIKTKYNNVEQPRFYVSPVWGKIKPVELVNYVKDHKITNVCVQVQLHKIIWNPEARGV